jgi:predicted Zn-dependent protease
VDDDALRALVDRTLISAALQPVDPYWAGATPPDEPTFTGNFDQPTADADPSQRATGVRAFVDAGQDLRAAGILDTEALWSAFASTAGQRATGSTTRATIDGIHQTATSAGAAHQTSVRIGELQADVAGEVAADLGRRSAEFVDVEPGSFEVVLAPEAVATIVTFLAAYGFNAKAHLEGASFAHLGEAQFDPSITLIEDPTDPRAIALPFDAEGSPRQRYALVQDGVTTSLAHDRRTAARADTRTTGNAIPGGEEFGAIPMNPRLVPGSTTPVEMIRNVDRGLLVTQFHYCRILDPKTMAVTGLTRNGTFLIEDGKIAGAVGNLRFTQSFLVALGAGGVLAIGDDDRHAAGEFGSGMIICPSLHLGAWNFTGGARG